MSIVLKEILIKSNHMETLKIALTGGVACGKSTVGEIFKKLGVPVIDLDTLSRQVVEKGSSTLAQLSTAFGEAILNADGTLNRAKLRDVMLCDAENKKTIEKILHPKILEKMQMAIKKLKTKLVVVEVQLLVESNLTHLFDRAIIVDCAHEKQLKRLADRSNLAKTEAEALIGAQSSREDRLKACDKLPTDVIENNSQIFDLEQKVNNLYQKLINL